MLNFKEGQTYICTESHNPWWTEGEEYKVILRDNGILYLIDDENDGYQESYINTIQTKFKLKEEKQILNFKEGQTYLCTRAQSKLFTEGKEYPIFINRYNRPVIIDDFGTYWYDDELHILDSNFILSDVKDMGEPPITDLIDNQTHYKNQGIEPIDLMRKNFSKEEFAGFLQGNVLKYMLRYKDKNGLEDLKKAKTYLTWLIKEEEK